jgi:hypothetical protein
MPAQQSEIIFDCPGIFMEIFTRAKLERIDKNAHDHDVIVPARAIDKGQMTGVQSAHRRHKTDGLALAPGGDKVFLEQADFFNCFHASVFGVMELSLRNLVFIGHRRPKDQVRDNAKTQNTAVEQKTIRMMVRSNSKYFLSPAETPLIFCCARSL